MAARSRYIVLFLFLYGCLLTSCANVITDNLIQPVVGNLQQQTDLQLVCEGAPAYLLMLDSMLVSSPDNKELLLTAAQSYSAYAAALGECGEQNGQRIPAITEKAKKYGQALLKDHIPLQSDPSEVVVYLEKQQKQDVEELFWGTFGWLTWVQYQRGSPASVADVVMIEKIMERLLVLDPTFQGGSIHMFFGSYYAAKPALLGGRPDLSRSHFEKALELSDRKFLLTQTAYAETFARMTMDGELHDNLLQEVIAFPLESAPEFTLSNVIAKSRAKKLLAENFFGD